MTPWPELLERHEAATFGDDALAIAATEYVAAEARVSPYWLVLLALAIGGAILAVLAI